MIIKRTLVVLALAASLALFAAGSAEVKIGTFGDDPKVDNVVLSTEIDDTTAEPQNEMSEFPSDVSVIYATVEIKNLKKGEKFEFRWLKGGEVGISREVELPDDAEHRWVYGSLEPKNGLEPGDDYEVEVYYNGELSSSAKFTVTE